MKGKLIIIEGVDSSGKATHTKQLYERLVRENYNVKRVEFLITAQIHLPW